MSLPVFKAFDTFLLFRMTLFIHVKYLTAVPSKCPVNVNYQCPSSGIFPSPAYYHFPFFFHSNSRLPGDFGELGEGTWSSGFKQGRGHPGC